MRIIHTADWHLGRTLEGRSRMAEQEEFMDELCHMAESEQADVVLMAGDVFDSVNPPASAEQLFYEGVSRLADKGKRQVILIAGNHDSPERLAAARPLAGEQGITLIGQPVPDLLTINVPSSGETLQVCAIPYPSESRLQMLLSANGEEEILRAAYDQRVAYIFERMCTRFSDDCVRVAMSHLYVAGSHETDSERPIQVGGAYTVAAPSLPQAAQYVALGHLHRPQNVHKAETLARYAGSPLAYSFSEAGQAKSVTLVDIDPRSVLPPRPQPVLSSNASSSEPSPAGHVEEIVLSSGRPLVCWQATEGLSQVHQWLDEGRDKEAWVDLELHLYTTPSIEDIQRLRERHPGLIHIRPQYMGVDEKQGDDQQGHSHLPIDELFRRFYERQTDGAQPDQELTQLFLDLVHEASPEEEAGE